MAAITGTAANDVLNGTVDADRIEGGAGNDRINAGAGDDEIFGGQGADILTGDAGNDRIFGEDGNDGVYGGGGNDYVDGGIGDDILIGDGGDDTLFGNTGNDRLFGGIGNDTLIGGEGNDIINGEAGDDIIIWRTGDGADTIIGGAGTDTLRLELTSADITAALRSDLAAYKQWAAGQSQAAGSAVGLAAQTSGASFTFASLGLTISVLEAVAISVDGTAVAIDDFLNAAPVAAAVASVTTAEDVAVEGIVAATDPDGDALYFTVENGPANGTLTLDASTGAFIYTPAANASGTDAFTVRITDQTGASTTQTVNVAVTAVADAPVVSSRDVVVALAQPVIGTDGDDVIVGNAAPDTVTFAVEIDAGLSDADGSESLSITLAGVPSEATLSAGVRQDNGTWLLSAADLPGLTVTAPASAGGFEISVSVSATEATGESATNAAALAVSFDHTGIEHNVIDGGHGNDVIDGGTGNDRLSGGSGDDTFLQRVGDGTDTVSGGDGVDLVELMLAASDVTPAFLSDVAAFQDWMSSGADGAFAFQSLGLTVDSIENLSITVDGRPVSIAHLLNVAPVAAGEVELTTSEDVVVEGVIEATDANGDKLTYSIEAGPASGSVNLDAATGAFAYVPGQNKSGEDSFSVRVTDAFGESIVQTVHVAVAAKADAPVLSASDVTYTVARVSTITGTRGNDNLRGDQHASQATFALAIAAALTDTDGSETLSVRIGGVPSGATLSAGQRQSDGSWVLQSADLGGLQMTVSNPSPFTLNVTAIAQDGVSYAMSDVAINVSMIASGNMNDRIIATTGTDTYDGGAGSDTVDYSQMTTGVTVNLATGTASGAGNQRLISIENVIGTSQNDTITGTNANSIIEAGAGNDRVNGGAGNDTFIDGAGDDRYDGGTGYDVLDYSKATRSVTVDDGNVSGMGNDRYSNVEKIIGSSFSDSFYGGKAVDTFDGGAGNDYFRGYEGSDIFTGGAGNDTFVWLEKDIVSGKKSQGVDTITDFGAGDRLDLTDITDGFLGLNALFGVDPASQVQVTDTSAGSMVAVKVGSSFYNVVLLQNVHGVTAASLLADGQLIA